MTDYIPREARRGMKYISTDALGDTLENFKERKIVTYAELVSEIAAIPAADVRPVVRGRWSRIDYEPHGHDYKCSACGWKNDMPTHFCPNCGADMRPQPPKEE